MAAASSQTVAVQKPFGSSFPSHPAMKPGAARA
jgi:hypothetical protein